MATSDSQQSLSSISGGDDFGAGGASLGRVGNRGGARSPSRQDTRRFSHAGAGFLADNEEPNDNDAGIQTIVRMLQRTSDREAAAIKSLNKSSRPGTAIFRGKTERERNASGSGGNPGEGITPAQPQGFFSLPILDKKKKESPLSPGPRRSSDDPRPSVKQGESGDTRKESKKELCKNDSAEASRSGLPDTYRPPVGQTQEEAAGINFRHRPGPDTPDEDNKFTSAGKGKSRDTTREIEQSKPRHGLALNGRKSTEATTSESTSPPAQHNSSSHRESQVALETDEEGEKTLVHDTSGIVRLGHAGFLTFGGGTRTGTGTRLKESGIGLIHSAAPGPTGMRLAQQQRQTKHVSSRTVHDFLNEQAHTVHLHHPNAALIPSPAPGAGVDGDVDLDGPGERDGLETKTGDDSRP